MYIAYTSRHRVLYSLHDSRVAAIAAALADETGDDPNFWETGGEIVGKELIDYTCAVYDELAPLFAELANGDEYSLPGQLRALAKAMDDSTATN